MKKIPFILLFLLCGLTAIAQTGDRVQVAGMIQMPPGDEARGISVFNINTSRGTVTNNRGEFNIEVAVGDSIKIHAVLFQDFTIVIDEGVVDSRELNVYVNEVVNLLPEVLVSPYDLTGNVRVDISRLPVVAVPDTLNSVNVQSMYFEIDAQPDYLSPPRNITLTDQQTGMAHGLNFANLFKELLVTSRRNQLAPIQADIDDKMRALYDDEFFRENLGIPLENVTDFIYYADDHGLSEKMLRAGNELDLINFLVEQSRRYKRDIARK